MEKLLAWLGGACLLVQPPKAPPAEGSWEEQLTGLGWSFHVVAQMATSQGVSLRPGRFSVWPPGPAFTHLPW